MPKIILNIRSEKDSVINDEKIACYIVADIVSKTTIEKVRATGKMVLVSGEKALTLCKEYNLDGIVKVIDPSKPLKPQAKPLREALRHKTLGLIVPARRHEAMLAGEVEPEFIGFQGEVPVSAEVISWYNELFLIPCAWVCKENDNALPKLDVDFVIVNAQNFKNFGC